MKTIGSLRITERSHEKMDMAIKRYNDKNTFPINQAQFRRMAIELLAQLILQGKDIPKINL